MIMASHLLIRNRVAEARAFTSLAARIDLDVVRHVSHIGDENIRILAANEAVLHSRRGKEIGRPCAIFGSASTKLDPIKEALIRSIFDHHQKCFEDSSTVNPRFSEIYGNEGSIAESHDVSPRILFIIPRYIKNTPSYIENDLFFHFSRSSIKADMTAYAFESDALTYNFPEASPFSGMQFTDACQRLDQALDQFKPDIIMLDGNFLPTNSTLNPSWLQAVRKEYGCQIVTVIGDCYDAAADYYGAWAEASDIMLTFNLETTHPQFSGHRNKNFLACGLPFDEEVFSSSESEKEIDMVFIGSNTRGRGDFLEMLRAYSVPIEAILHNRLATNAPNLSTYANFLRKGRITYNTGRVESSSSFSVLTGRCFEAILSKTVLLEEVGSALDDYFIPFIHYVPFSNSSQLIMFSQFLCANHDYRQRIADQAYAWHQQRYTSRRFWDALQNRLRSIK